MTETPVAPSLPHPRGTQETHRLPTQRGCPLSPPKQLAEFQATGGPTRLTFPDGHEGWLLTRYEDIRAALADPRFSSEFRRLVSPVRESKLTKEDMDGLPFRRSMIATDPPDHTRLRRMVTGQFTVRRMRQLEPWIGSVVDEHLDAMAEHGGPIDLVQALALPVPSLVICQLLGVPYEDRAGFQDRTATLLGLDSTREELLDAIPGMDDYMLELVRAKQADPTDDLLSDVVRATPIGAPLTEEELVGIGNILLIAGHETTANMLGLSTFALLRERARWEELREHPELVEKAVEELMRHLSIIQFGLVRTVKAPVELGGVTLQPDETVVLHIPAGNRDPEQFPNPDELDFHRPTNRHLGFGHGVHQCLGQQLARVEMRAALGKLIQRFPDLRLAVPADEVPFRDDMGIYGVHQLPVTWG